MKYHLMLRIGPEAKVNSPFARTLRDMARQARATGHFRHDGLKYDVVRENWLRVSLTRSQLEAFVGDHS